MSRVRYHVVVRSSRQRGACGLFVPGTQLVAILLGAPELNRDVDASQARLPESKAERRRGGHDGANATISTPGGRGSSKRRY